MAITVRRLSIAVASLALAGGTVGLGAAAADASSVHRQATPAWEGGGSGGGRHHHHHHHHNGGGGCSGTTTTTSTSTTTTTAPPNG
ncbi:MAG: hypothetical protein ACLPQS_11430 [Acidimicrobiales bacterium]